MATSQDYMSKIEQMGTMPDYRNVIADAYKAPVLQPLVNEGANLEAKYLPTMFDIFAKSGTGASDMSPAAKLAFTGQNLGSLMSKVSSNNNIQGFYNSQIQDLAGVQAQKWMQQMQTYKDLMQAKLAEENSRRAAAAAGGGAGNLNALRNLLSKGGAGGNPTMNVPGGNFKTLQEMNAYMQASGLNPVTQEYFNNTYNHQNVMPKTSQIFANRIADAYQTNGNSYANNDPSTLLTRLFSGAAMPIIGGLQAFGY